MYYLASFVSVHDHKILPGEMMQVRNETLTTLRICMSRVLFSASVQVSATYRFASVDNLKRVVIVLNQVSVLQMFLMSFLYVGLLQMLFSVSLMC